MDDNLEFPCKGRGESLKHGLLVMTAEWTEFADLLQLSLSTQTLLYTYLISHISQQPIHIIL